jgi:peptide/nickel transport system permease protein
MAQQGLALGGAHALPRDQAATAQERRFVFLRRVCRRPVCVIACALVVLMVILAIAAPLIAPYNPLTSHAIDRLEGPSSKYLLGTDQLGRDVLSRIIYGARTSVLVGFLAVLISTGGGTVVGVVSGYFGGMLDTVIQRFVDALQAFPGLILALALVSVVGSGLPQVIFIIGILVAPSDSRVMRGAVLALRNTQFIESARAGGASDLRLIVRHILPNIVAPLLVLGSTMFGLAILIEGALSFLGLGTPPPTPSWGNMIGAGLSYVESAPTLTIFPGIAMSLFVLGFNLLGDELRDLLDPRLRGSRG